MARRLRHCYCHTMNTNGGTMNKGRANIAVTKRGKLIHLDAEGEREFSPRVVGAIRYASVALVAGLVVLAVLIGTGLMPPAPWSPMRQTEHVPAPPSFTPRPDLTLPPSEPIGPPTQQGDVRNF